jgi:CCR4-NOT transcription complex subunit 7/8
MVIKMESQIPKSFIIFFAAKATAAPRPIIVREVWQDNLE